MYFLNPAIKENPVRRWNLPDRIFFGHGACHILAGVFLEERAGEKLWAEWIRPSGDTPGTHIYVTNGEFAFDFHGICVRSALLAHHERGWASRFPDWKACIEPVEFDLLDTSALNARKMRGPDQYLHDPIPRARRFIGRTALAMEGGPPCPPRL